MDPADMYGGATDDEQQQALAAALRRQQAMGLLGQLSGDKVLGNVGDSLLSGAQAGYGRLEKGKERKLMLGLEAKKDAELQQYRADQMKQHQDDMAQRERDRELQRLGLTDQRKAAAQQRQDIQDERMKLRQDALTSSLSEKMLHNLDEGGWTGPIKDQVEGKYRADHLLKLAKKVGSEGWNNLSDTEQTELAMGFGQLVGGGKPAEGEVMRLIPPENLQSGAQGIKQWFTNEPLGRNQVAFVERLGHSIQRQRDVAQELINKEKAQRAGAEQKLREMAPQQWEANIIGAGLDPTKFDEKGVYRAAVTGDDWKAKASARIKELMGQGVADPKAIRAQLEKEHLDGR